MIDIWVREAWSFTWKKALSALHIDQWHIILLNKQKLSSSHSVFMILYLSFILRLVSVYLFGIMLCCSILCCDYNV